MSNNHFIATLDMLHEFKQNITDESIQNEIQLIYSTVDISLYKYAIELHAGVDKPFMRFNFYKGLSCANYGNLRSHIIYDDLLVNYGYIISKVLYARETEKKITLDFLNSDYSNTNNATKFRLFIILCVVTYYTIPLDELRLGFIKYQIPINAFSDNTSTLVQRYLETDDLEYMDMANYLLLQHNKTQLGALIHKIHSAYKINRFYEYVEVPNLFELCSYDRTPDDGYSIKCFNKSYQLAAIRNYTAKNIEDMKIDAGYSYIGGYCKINYYIYKQLLIDFHQHIYKKEIDVERLHQLIVAEGVLSHFERRIAILLHRATIKHFILSGHVDNIVFKNIIPKIEKRGIVAYNPVSQLLN